MKHCLFILLVVVLSACTKPQKTPYLTLKPDIPISDKIELYYLEDTYTLFDVTTIDEESSNIYFRKDTVPEGIYELRINNKPIAPIIISSALPFSINGNFAAGLEQLSVTNNEETKALWKAKLIANTLTNEIQQVAINIPDSLPENEFNRYRDSLYLEINGLIDNTRNKLNKLNKKHQKSLLPLFLVKLQAGNHRIFHPENNSDEYYELSNHLKNQYPKYAPVQQFAFQIDSLMSWNVFNSITKEGRKLPSISIPNAWGQEFVIDSIDDKPTLFLIWNSTDKASRDITKRFMRWSWPYRNKGVQVCMISLDDNKDDWLTAIKQDRLAVLHLSDLKGKQSQIMDQLGLKTIPTLLLINKEKIIVKRTTELEKLTASIEEIIKN